MRAGPSASLPPAARSQRVYAAISRLRRLGMHGILVKRDDGYALDESWRVETDGAVHLNAASAGV